MEDELSLRALCPARAQAADLQRAQALTGGKRAQRLQFQLAAAVRQGEQDRLQRSSGPPAVSLRRRDVPQTRRWQRREPQQRQKRRGLTWLDRHLGEHRSQL